MVRLRICRLMVYVFATRSPFVFVRAFVGARSFLDFSVGVRQLECVVLGMLSFLKVLIDFVFKHSLDRRVPHDDARGTWPLKEMRLRQPGSCSIDWTQHAYSSILGI